MEKIDLKLDVRAEVLSYSLIVESMLSHFVAQLIGIKDASQTLCFGNSSQALSFNQKINLLIDIGQLERSDRVKFITFMEVRNQFVHNISAKNYETTFSYAEGKAAWILKIYPQDTNETRENQLRSAFSQLANEVAKISVGLWDKIKTKIKKEVELQTKSKVDGIIIEAYEKAAKEFEKGVNEYFAKMYETNPDKKFTMEGMKNSGTEIMKIYKGFIMKELNKHAEPVKKAEETK